MIEDFEIRGVFDEEDADQYCEECELIFEPGDEFWTVPLEEDEGQVMTLCLDCYERLCSEQGQVPVTKMPMEN